MTFLCCVISWQLPCRHTCRGLCLQHDTQLTLSLRQIWSEVSNQAFFAVIVFQVGFLSAYSTEGP